MNFSGIDNMNNYTGCTYDDVLSIYFVQNRFCDPAARRFIQEDKVKDGLNWYTYCGNDPVNYTDPWGLLPHPTLKKYGAAEALEKFLRDKWLLATLGAEVDEKYEAQGKTIYYLPQDYWQSFECVGYNKFYDMVFDTVSDMKPAFFDFTYQREEFRIWAWKGDYLNMGAGAELGIYHGGGPHWKTGKDYSMTMSIKLEDKNGVIFERNSNKDTWWVTGFDYARKGNPKKMTATYTLNFSVSEEMKGMYNAFVESKDFLDPSKGGWQKNSSDAGDYKLIFTF
jgi:RHS repeat-associated protein